MSLEVCHTRYYEKKKGHNSFFIGKFAFFFKNLCFQQPLRSSRNALISSTVIVRIACGPLKIVPWGLSHSIIREKIGHIVFFTGNIAFFSKICVFSNHLGLKKCSYGFYNKCQNSFWILTNCPWGLSHSILREKIGHNIFFIGNIAIFFKSLCFQKPQRSLKSSLISSRVTTRKSFGPLQIVPWGLSHSIIREKIGHKVFFTGNIAFFFKNLCFQQTLRS